jgi:hypothetical protein
MKTKRNLLVFLFAFILLAACARPYTSYVVTRQGYNDVLEEYLDWYDTQPANMRAECKAKIDPQVERATAALDAWGHSLDLGGAWTERDKFMDIQEALMKDLLRLYQGGAL